MEKRNILHILLLISSFISIISPVFAQNVFLEMVQRLRMSGMFDLFLFVLFFAVFFAILSKTKILGGNQAVNGVVAIVTAFFISLYSTFTGFSLIEPISRFIVQTSVIALIFLAALLLASFFYPELTKMLTEHIKGPTILYVLIPLALALLITSRTVWVFWAGYKVTPGLGVDVVTPVVALLILGVILLIVGAVARGGK